MPSALRPHRRQSALPRHPVVWSRPSSLRPPGGRTTPRTPGGLPAPATMRLTRLGRDPAGLWIMPLPGTPDGHQSLVIRRPDGTVIRRARPHTSASAFAAAELRPSPVLRRGAGSAAGPRPVAAPAASPSTLAASCSPTTRPSGNPCRRRRVGRLPSGQRPTVTGPAGSSSLPLRSPSSVRPKTVPPGCPRSRRGMRGLGERPQVAGAGDPGDPRRRWFGRREPSRPAAGGACCSATR